MEISHRGEGIVRSDVVILSRQNLLFFVKNLGKGVDRQISSYRVNCSITSKGDTRWKTTPLTTSLIEEAVPFPLLLQKGFFTHQAMQDEQAARLIPTPQTPQETVLPFPLVFEESVVWEEGVGLMLLQTVDGEVQKVPLLMGGDDTNPNAWFTWEYVWVDDSTHILILFPDGDWTISMDAPP